MSKYTSQSGIYVISNTKNGKVYIGKASNFKDRWNNHKKLLRDKSHYNPYLQNAWNKYGEKAFKFQVLEYCPVEELNEREIHHIAIYKARGLAYNLTNGGDGIAGYSLPDDVKKRMSEAKKGNKNPNFGKPMNPEIRAIFDQNRIEQNALNSGKPRNAETRAKISASKRGKTLSDETRRRMSEAHKGEKNHRFGQKLSDETKAKISASEKGRIISEETRLKMSDAHKGRRNKDD